MRLLSAYDIGVLAVAQRLRALTVDQRQQVTHIFTTPLEGDIASRLATDVDAEFGFFFSQVSDLYPVYDEPAMSDADRVTATAVLEVMRG